MHAIMQAVLYFYVVGYHTCTAAQISSQDKLDRSALQSRATGLTIDSRSVVTTFSSLCWPNPQAPVHQSVAAAAAAITAAAQQQHAACCIPVAFNSTGCGTVKPHSVMATSKLLSCCCEGLRNRYRRSHVCPIKCVSHQIFYMYCKPGIMQHLHCNIVRTSSGPEHARYICACHVHCSK